MKIHVFFGIDNLGAFLKFYKKYIIYFYNIF